MPSTSSPGSIIQQIWNGAVKDFNTAKTWIANSIAKVEAVLPGASPLVKDVEQFASDALGTVTQAAQTYEPAFVTALEAAADTAIGTLSGPYAQPLNAMANNAIQDVVQKGTAALTAWSLKVQAQLAENVAVNMTVSKAAPQSPPPPPAAAPQSGN